jgi:hypothetical protein
MSGSMSKSEIEEVLSSISRLVTEENLQQRRPIARSSDKLLLTPALRIEPALSDVPQPLQAEEPLLPVPDQKGDAAATAAHQAAAALEAALEGRRDDWEPDGTELVRTERLTVGWELLNGDDAPDVTGPAGPIPAREDAADHRVAPGAPPALVPVDSVPEDNAWDDFLAVHHSTPLLAAEQADPWHPLPDPEPEPGADLPGIPEIALAPHAEPDTGIPEIALAPHAEPDTSIPEITLAPHAEPDNGLAPDPVQEALPPTVPPLSGQAGDGTVQEDGDQPVAPPADLSSRQDVFGSLPDDGLSGPQRHGFAPDIDEGLLRDLIREVLREELHGELGERITRNLRKLVRAEIARALTARNLN